MKGITSKSFMRPHPQIAEASLSPISTKRTKTNISNNYPVENSYLQTEVSESMLGHNNNLMDAFKLER
jgi:hypothetical protein